MLRDRLPVEGQYAVNIEYAPWFIANNGRLFDVVGDIPSGSTFTAGVAYGAVDFTTSVVNGDALLISGITDPVAIGSSYMHLPWQPLLLLPLAVVAIYYRACSLAGTRPKAYGIALLVALALFGNYSMVSWGLSGGLGLPYGWVLFLAIYLALLARATKGQPWASWGLCLVVLLCLLQPTYHTIAVAILVSIGTIAIVQRVSGDDVVPARTAVLTAVIFAAFLVYHATPFLRAYSTIGLSFLNDILRSHDAASSQYLFRLSGPLQELQVVNYVALALIPLLSVGAWLWTRGTDDQVSRYQVMWLVALVPLGVGFFAWNGFLGAAARLLQLGMLLALSGAALVLSRNWPRAHVVLGIAIVVSTCISAFTVGSVGIGKSALVSNAEWQAVRWYGATGCTKAMFTDFRIGSVMPYVGCFKVVGPSAADLALRGQTDVVPDLFYRGDPRQITSAVDRFTVDGQRVELILVSREMVDPRAGIILEDGLLLPMSEESWSAYQRLPGWTIVYSTSDVIVIQRDESTAGLP